METLVALNEDLINSVAASITDNVRDTNKPHNEKTCNVCRIANSLNGHVDIVEVLVGVALDENPPLALLRLLAIYMFMGIKYAQALKEVEELENLESLVKKEPNG